MSRLQEQVKFHVTEMTKMLAAQEGTLSWYTRFGDHWRELLKLYPDPRWIASLGAQAAPGAAPSTPSVQQTPSPSPSDPPKQTNPPPPAASNVHYQVDLDKLRGVISTWLKVVRGSPMMGDVDYFIKLAKEKGAIIEV